MGEIGILIWPGFGFRSNLFIACNTSFYPLSRSFNALTKLQNSNFSSSSPIPFPYQSVYWLGPCLFWYLLTRYLQIPDPQCTYSSFFYMLQKYILLYSFTYHVQAHSWQGTCYDNTVISQTLIFYYFIIIGFACILNLVQEYWIKCACKVPCQITLKYN